MRWTDSIVLATRNVLRRPGRAVLTVLAVALAATLFTALLTIARTAESRVLDQLSSGGPLAGIKVVAAAPDPGQLNNDNATPGPPKRLDDSAVSAVAAIPEVKSVTRVISNDSIVVAPEKLPNGEVVKTPESDSPLRKGSTFQKVVGVDLRQVKQLPITAISGRVPAPGSTNEVAVTPSYLEALGIDPAQQASVVGAELQLGAPQALQSGGRIRFVGQWNREVVVGIVAQDAAPGQLVVSIEQAQSARTWTAASVENRGLDVPTSPYDGLFVVSKSLNDVGGARTAITNVGYSTSAPENLIASVERYLEVVKIILGAVGAIALAISALGITNAMLAAVRERRREIGVLKAIGAKDRDVALVFLSEAAALGAIGGVVGTAVGLTIAQVVAVIVNGYLADQGLAGVHAALPVGLVAISVLGATGVAVMAGFLPAVRAARLAPREAVDA